MNPEPLIMPEDLRFIRTQDPAAIPLLAELYGIPVDRVKFIRVQRAHGEKMPPASHPVQRRRAELRLLGFPCRTPEPLEDPWAAANLANHAARRRRG